jgi:hypothetical protein
MSCSKECNCCHFPFERGAADFRIVTSKHFQKYQYVSLSMTAKKPVLIVGMMAAIELNRFGIPVRLIDKLLEPPTTSRAI